jgi:hypothetical protein
MFKETIALYSKNNTKHTNTSKFCARMYRFSELKQVVHREPLGFKGLRELTKDEKAV